MIVLNRPPMRERAVNPARADDRKLEREINPGFQNHLLSARRRERGFGLIRASDLRLPFAVIAEPGGLQNRGTSEFVQPGLQIFKGVHGPERRDRKTVIAEESLLAQPVLRDV